jgi:hypothetical protein
MTRHRHQEWIKFLKEIDARKPPEIDLHLIADPRQQRDRRDAQAPGGEALVEASPAVLHVLHPHQ